MVFSHMPCIIERKSSTNKSNCFIFFMSAAISFIALHEVVSVFLCKVGVGLVLDGLLCDCYLSLPYMRLSVYSYVRGGGGFGLVLDGLLCDCYLSLSHMRLSVYSYVRWGLV